MHPNRITKDIQFQLPEVGGVVCPEVAHLERLVHGTNDQISKEIGVKFKWMSGYNMAFAPGKNCIILLFSDSVEFQSKTLVTLAEIGVALGERLEQVARKAIADGRVEMPGEDDGDIASGVES